MGLRIARAAQALVLRTAGGPLRRVWLLGYAVALRGLGLLLTAGVRGATLYATGSAATGELVPGVSDLDLALVVPAGGAPAARARWRRLAERVTVLGAAADVSVHDAESLRAGAGASTLTYGLDRPAGGSAYADGAAWLREGPGLYGPMTGWRRLRGPEVRPALPPADDQEHRLRAWLQLQSWWRWTFAAVLEPDAPWVRLHGVKLVAEPLRILLWLDARERPGSRRDALARGAAAYPEHTAATERALELAAAPPHRPRSALDELLPTLVALSGEIAERLDAAAGGVEAREVTLAGETRRPPAAAASESAAPGGEPATLAGEAVPPPPAPGGERVPLADWRAVVFPWSVDETAIPDSRDPGDPDALAAAARAEETRAYRVLRAGPLLVLPTARGASGRGRMRAVQCPATDPVTTALLAGRARAAFPALRGWRAEDWARRALAEHRAALSGLDPAAPDALAIAWNGARAAAFEATLGDDAPVLPLTPEATAETLPAPAAAAGLEALAALRAGAPVPPAAVAELAAAVTALPAYAAA